MYTSLTRFQRFCLLQFKEIKYTVLTKHKSSEERAKRKDVTIMYVISTKIYHGE